MSLDELDIHTILKRMEKIESVDLDERLTYIEKQLKFFTYACSSIDNSFKHGVKVNLGEDSLTLVVSLNNILSKLNTEVVEIRRLRHDVQDQLKDDSVMGTLKFMAKTLHDLVQQVNTIKEDGLKKDIQLAFTVDGYEMVKRRPPKLNPEIETEEDLHVRAIERLLATLDDREKTILIHRYGLLGENKKTLKAVGKIFSISGERIAQMQRKALRRCRHHSRKNIVDDLTHVELRNAILGDLNEP